MKWKKWLPLIGILLFIYILIKIDLFEVLKEIKNVEITFIFIALIFVIIMFFIQTFKWYAIAVFQDIRMPFLEAVRINFITNFYGFVTPSKLGTIIRAEYLKKYTGNIGKGLCNFTLDKILDIGAVIFLAILFSFIFKDKLNLPVGFFVLFFLSFVLVSLFFMGKNRSRFILKIFYKKFVPEKLKDTARVTFDSFYDHIPQKRYFILFFLLNLINWVNIYLITYFVGRSLGIELSFIYYLAILPITTLVTLIPITINGLGTQEITMISLFALFGVESSKVFSMSIINLLMGILFSLIGIIFIWNHKD